MSTILNALKKLEHQRQSQPTGGAQHQRPYIPGRGSAKNRRFMALAITTAILFTAGTTWLVARLSFRTSNAPSFGPNTAAPVMSQKNANPGLPEDSASQIQETPEVMSPITLPSEEETIILSQMAAPPIQEETKTVTSPATTDAVSVPETKAAPARAAEPEIKLPTRPPPEVAGESASETMRGSDQAITTEAAAPAQEVTPEEPAMSDETAMETVPSFPRLENSDLKLQAVTWADIPANRFAVLNNKIVRVGDLVEGYRIAEIGEDYVVVDQKGRRWEVRFRPR